MDKVVIFGVGNNYLEFKKKFQSTYEIVCLVDNKYKEIDMEGVYSPSVILEKKFDYIIVTPSIFEEIYQQLLGMGIPKEKIRLLSLLPELSAKQFGNNVYWGQHGDDLIIAAIFTRLEIDHPSYIDVGANFPFLNSNTAALYLNGCKGICVEANPDVFRLLEYARPNDININVGVGAIEGELPFYIHDEFSGLNTFCKEEAEQWFSEKEPRIVKLPVVKLSSIIDKYCPDGFPDFLDIDIEGLDYEVLESCDFSVDGPKVICVEVRTKDVEKFDAMLIAKGYFRFCRIAANNIYVHKRYSNATIYEIL